MVSSSSEDRASKMSIVRRRSVTRMLAVAPGRPIGGGQVWFTSNNAARVSEVPGGCERVPIRSFDSPSSVSGCVGCFGTALRAGEAPPLNPARRAPVPPYPQHESGAPPPHPQAYSAAAGVRHRAPGAAPAGADRGGDQGAARKDGRGREDARRERQRDG